MAAKQRIARVAGAVAGALGMGAAAAGCGEDGPQAGAGGGRARAVAQGAGLEVPVPAGFSAGPGAADQVFLVSRGGATIEVRPARLDRVRAQAWCAGEAVRVKLGELERERVDASSVRGLLCSWIERPGPTPSRDGRLAGSAMVALFGENERIWIARCSPERARAAAVETVGAPCLEALAGWRAAEGETR